MSGNTKVDFVIFGATGYTGKYVVKEFILISENKYTWAIAGRNPDKLREILKWATFKTGQDVSKTAIITCDCEDEASMSKMTQCGRVIINCCGPYRFYGEAVIKACIENGVHQVDICAEIEVEYMETIQLKYHEAAEKKGVYIVSACGLESVPCDLGVIHFMQNFPGQVNSIESFLMVTADPNEPLLNFRTWDSAIYGLGYMRNLVPLREKLHSLLNPPELKPRMKFRPIIHRCELFDNNLAIPILKSHQSAIFRTQMFLRNYYGQRPVQHYAYYVSPSFTHFLKILLIGLFLTLFIHFNLGRRLLIRYCEFFSCGLSSKKGPSETATLNTSISYKFKGEGWTKAIADRFENKEEIDVPPDKKMVTELTFIDGYCFTARSIICCTFTVLTERDKMPSRGGVYTPGAAFYKTNLMDQLLKNGVSLNIVKND